MKNYLICFFIALVTSACAILIYHFTAKKKIGYIKNGVILTDYKAMKHASEQFEKELAVVRSNVDTLKNRYENLKNEEKYVKASEKALWNQKLGVAENDYFKYSEQADQQMQARRQELTNEVLQKINGFIKSYGDKHGYALILGTTQDGSVLYGEENDDITDEILSELNKDYEATPKK